MEAADVNLIKVGADFETHYTKEYSLRKLTMAQYIRDARFEVIGVSLVVGSAPPSWFSGTHAYLQKIFDAIPWDRCLFIAHNAMFDGGILEWIFSKKPAKYFCSMMGIRPYVAPAIGSMALGPVLKYLELGEKGDAVHNYSGRRRETFTPEELRHYGDYSKNDAVGACRIADYAMKLLPQDEQDLIDLTIKKFTRPQLCVDATVAKYWLGQVGEKREATLQGLIDQGVPVTKAKLASRPQFAQLLEARGVKPPKKASPSNPEEETFAFAKQDIGLLELKAHPDLVVRELVDARLMFASNIDESRLQRFIDQSELTPEASLAVPLLYWGASPGRFSGYDSLNLQNLPRVDKQKPLSPALRSSIVAPPGYVVLAGDLSTIEARIVATLSGQWDLVQQFRNGLDVYSDFASDFYRRKIDKVNFPSERFVGKTCVLGLGYGMAWKKLQFRLALEGIHLSDAEAQAAVKLYRYKKYPRIPELWGKLDTVLGNIADPKYLGVDDPLMYMHERIRLPNGMSLWYPGLRPSPRGLEYIDPKYGPSPVWGGTILQHLGEALGRIIISTAELRLARAGLRAALQVHDELVFVVPEKFVERCRVAVEKALTAPVSWLPNLPVACEIHYGKSYSDAK